MADGTEIEEPEAIEGYLYRLKPKSEARMSVYLSSHGGNIFVTKPAHAFPPPIPQARVSPEFSSIPPFAYSLEDEKRRVSSQILNSIGCVDLRDILVVRRASLASHTETNPASSTGTSPGTQNRMDDNATSQDMGAEEDSDMEEPGGETYLQSHKNSYRLRQKRTLEVTLQAGVTVRFEVCSVLEPILPRYFRLTNLMLSCRPTLSPMVRTST